MLYAPDHGGWYSPSDYLFYLSELPDMEAPDELWLGIASDVYSELGQDRFIDVIQRGNGFTTILGFHSSPTDKLEVGLKYEFPTKVELTTEVIDGKDGGLVAFDDDGNKINQFTDGEVIRSDLPAFLAAGVNYELSPRLTGALGGRYMFDKTTNYNGREKQINANYFEIEIAAEYKLRWNALISGGYTYARPNVTDAYQSEVDFRVPGHTIGVGGMYALNDDIQINLGFMYTRFERANNQYFQDIGGDVGGAFVPAAPVPYNLGFEKDAMLFAIGVDFELSNKSN